MERPRAGCFHQDKHPCAGTVNAKAAASIFQQANAVTVDRNSGCSRKAFVVQQGGDRVGQSSLSKGVPNFASNASADMPLRIP
jgi:hypothetical protein